MKGAPYHTYHNCNLSATPIILVILVVDAQIFIRIPFTMNPRVIDVLEARIT